MRFAAWSIYLLTLPLAAEFNRTFTVDDMLDVKTGSFAALRDDGQRLAATTSSLRDRTGIDTRSGKSQEIFADRRQVRGLVWSPKGAYLAMRVLEGELFRPVIWN
jgi:hypothetical protein